MASKIIARHAPSPSTPCAFGATAARRWGLTARRGQALAFHAMNADIRLERRTPSLLEQGEEISETRSGPD